ncbi:MAG: phosphoribosylformylglycinamidine synthase subunit PurQ [Gemmatimonadetes bacterium]|nr:phosphoribosylformylglycinamidine synthase subunit PurQ [Gemmatimonadota bacterium]
MRVAIVTFPGSNCDYDCYKAVTDVLGAQAAFVWHRETALDDPDVVILPGGFSYGDYLRAGAIARFSPIMRAVQSHAADGGLVLGICNGFQILCEAGLLPGALIRNRSLRFQGERVRVRVENVNTPFTRDYAPDQVLGLHIAHGEGNYVADEPTLNALEAGQRVVLRYVDADGQPTDASNANGSMRNIAGILNNGGNVLGIMPHPERSVEALLGSTDGLGIFTSLYCHIDGAAPAPAGKA